MLAILLYRQLILRQPISQYGDIAAVFFIGAIYVAFSNFASGMFSGRFPKFARLAIPIVIVTMLVVLYVMGQLNSWGDILQNLLGALVGMAVVYSIFYALNRFWEKKNDLD